MPKLLTRQEISRDHTHTPEVPTFVCESRTGVWARQTRLSLKWTPQQLAIRAGVLTEDVNRLENNLPLSQETKNKLLHELWIARTNDCGVKKSLIQ